MADTRPGGGSGGNGGSGEDGGANSAASPPGSPPASIVPLALCVSIAFLMETLDSTILIAALPAIGDDFGIPPLRVNVAVTVYLVTLAVMIPASSWLADRFGARRVFLLAVLGFMVTSLGAALSQSLAQLVVMRIAQATAGAMMTPIGRLLLIRHTPRAHLASAIIWMSTPVQIGPVLGPLLGGWIVTYATWPLIFLVNLPLGLIGLVFAMRILPADAPAQSDRATPRAPFDWRGFGLIAIVLAAAQIVIDQLVHPLLPVPLTLALLLAVPVAMGLYLRRPAPRPPGKPALDLSLMRLRLFRLALGWGVPARIGINAVPFLLQLQLQLGFGWSAARAGTVVVLIAGGAIVLKPFAAMILRRAGFRRGLAGNAGIAAALTVALALVGPDTPLPVLVALVLAFGISRSLQFNLINTLVFADVPADRQSSSTALAGVGQQLSMALGISIAAVLVAQLGALGIAPGAAAISAAMVGMAAITALAGLGYALTLRGEDGAAIATPARRPTKRSA